MDVHSQTVSDHPNELPRAALRMSAQRVLLMRPQGPGCHLPGERVVPPQAPARGPPPQAPARGSPTGVQQLTAVSRSSSASSSWVRAHEVSPDGSTFSSSPHIFTHPISLSPNVITQILTEPMWSRLHGYLDVRAPSCLLDFLSNEGLSGSQIRWSKQEEGWGHVCKTGSFLQPLGRSSSSIWGWGFAGLS